VKKDGISAKQKADMPEFLGP